MATHSNKLCQTNGDGGESDRKHQKLVDSEDTAVEVNRTEVKTITNIYYDCLEHIFDRLDFESLLNLADTCKRLRMAAAAKFADEYGKRHIRLHPKLSYHASAYINDFVIEVTCLKSCFQLLRCFGSKVSQLSVGSYRYDPKKIYYLHQYISQYCADTLNYIPFENSEFLKI